MQNEEKASHAVSCYGTWVDFLKVVRLVRSLALRARTIAPRAHSRATRSKARLVSKSRSKKFTDVELTVSLEKLKRLYWGLEP